MIMLFIIWPLESITLQPRKSESENYFVFQINCSITWRPQRKT